MASVRTRRASKVSSTRTRRSRRRNRPQTSPSLKRRCASQRVRICWIRHGYSCANLLSSHKLAQWRTLDPHLTLYARLYSVYAGNDLVRRRGFLPSDQTLRHVYSSYLKRATETAVWMFSKPFPDKGPRCRSYCQLPYIAEGLEVHGITGVVRKGVEWVGLGQDNTCDTTDSSVIVPTSKQSALKPSRLPRVLRAMATSSTGALPPTSTLPSTADEEPMPSLTIRRDPYPDGCVPDWPRFQAYFVQHRHRLPPSYTTSNGTPCYVIVSHSQFMKSILRLPNKPANNQCFPVDYCVDPSAMTLTPTKRRRQPVASPRRAPPPRLQNVEAGPTALFECQDCKGRPMYGVLKAVAFGRSRKQKS